MPGIGAESGSDEREDKKTSKPSSIPGKIKIPEIMHTALSTVSTDHRGKCVRS